MHRTTAVALLLAAAASAATTASLLNAPATAPDLRAALAAHAATTTSGEDAGQAWSARARSFWRAAQKDSAIANHRRALDRRGAHEDRLALTDALLRRRGPGDTTEVRALLEPVMPALGGESAGIQAAYAARLGWTEHLTGHPQRALTLLSPFAEQLVRDPAWRLRVAAVTLAAGNYREAYTLATPLLLASRRKDQDAADLLQKIGATSGAGSRLDVDLERMLTAFDGREADVLVAIGGRRVRFQAGDGEYVSGVVLRPTRERPRAAVVVMAPGDSIADYDSLAVALVRGGLAVMLMEPRGTGRSVSATVPGPDTWDGREDALESRVARDASDGLSALAREMPLDSSRAALVAVGTSATLAMQVVERDRRFHAVVLVSPKVEPVARPAMLERGARLKPAIFVQTSPEEYAQRAFVERLLHTVDERASRAVETRSFSGGATQFRLDIGLGRRVTEWIGETLSGKRSPSATPRSTPRRG